MAKSNDKTARANAGVLNTPAPADTVVDTEVEPVVEPVTATPVEAEAIVDTINSVVIRVSAGIVVSGKPVGAGKLVRCDAPVADRLVRSRKAKYHTE